MKITGMRKFVCAECGEATWFHWVERGKRAIPRCRWCGSTAIDPATRSKVNDEIMQEGANL